MSILACQSQPVWLLRSCPRTATHCESHVFRASCRSLPGKSDSPARVNHKPPRPLPSDRWWSTVRYWGAVAGDGDGRSGAHGFLFYVVCCIHDTDGGLRRVFFDITLGGEWTLLLVGFLAAPSFAYESVVFLPDVLPGQQSGPRSVCSEAEWGVLTAGGGTAGARDGLGVRRRTLGRDGKG